MVTRPELILADEPTGNLDSKSATELLEMTRAAVDGFGQTVVMVTHDARAASYADRVVFLADGRIVHQITRPTMGGILDELKALGG
jgi:putative ABC transport system ATP-binding protein